MYSIEELLRPKDPRRAQPNWLNPTAPPAPTGRLPDGRTMEEAMAAMGGAAPAPVGPGTGPSPVALPTVPQPRIGTEVSPSLSPLGRKLAEYRTLQGAGVSSKVREQPWGYEEQPPGVPSRKKQALIGLLQGTTMAAQATKGDPWGTLAGAGVGAVAGGVSPTLMEALTRQQELQRMNADTTGLQELELKNAQIDETRAQTKQREAAAQMEIYRDPETGEEYSVRGGEAARIAASKARQKAALSAKAAEESAKRALLVPYTDPGTGDTVMVDPAEKIRLTQGQRRIDKAPGTRLTRTLNGQIWERGDDGHWEPAPGSPPPEAKRDIPGEKAAERTTEARAKSVQAANLFQKGHDYWEQAKQKRDEAAKLGSTVAGRVQSKERITQLEREAAGLEDQTRKVQQKGDELAAEADAAGATVAPAGQATEADIRARALERNLDPDEAVRRWNARRKNRR